MDEAKYIKRFRWITLVSGTILVLLLLTAWISESFMVDWKHYQSDYRELAMEYSEDEEASIETRNRIYQVSPVGLNRTDRCITCHMGIENPSMSDASQPHTLHPGNHLANHPVEKFGCTVCHGGQGRAIDRINAFGEDPSTHWNFPLLHPPYIESSCGKYHLSIFSEQVLLEGTATFLHGKEVFSREGCLGCHQARGVGGIIGPDLTEQGEKTKHEYSFTNVKGDQTISNWLKEHFRDPEMVSPGSDMLQMNLPEEELQALVTFTMGLAKPDISYEYIGVEALQEFRGMRPDLPAMKAYSMICSSCHGKNGEGKDYQGYKTGVPSLGNNDFVRVASDEMMAFTILHGRGGKQMASWLPLYSGLTHNEIDSIVKMLDGKFDVSHSFADVSRISGEVESGRDLYKRDCAMCHGENGRGDIGLPLNNADFLSAASDRFLYNTISQGRNTAGMPAWTGYSAAEMADLTRYIRTWGGGPRDDVSIDLPVGDPVQGDLQFHYLCSRCHGEFGEGNTGPAILTRDFQSLASDRYLYQTISGGRSHTAMFGWSTDVQGAGKLDRQGVSDIISYMRDVSSRERDYIYQGSNPGNAAAGKGLFSSHCAECHGESGEGLKAPALNNQEFLNAATNGYLIATISIGRDGTRMPSWGAGSEELPVLSATQRQDLAAYIRSWQRFRIRR
ncbi:MAG TPA: c-type cytochrome [Bacteroides sp.]|nr:c-type cytochrome [Bacteroides sp.]